VDRTAHVRAAWARVAATVPEAAKSELPLAERMFFAGAGAVYDALVSVVPDDEADGPQRMSDTLARLLSRLEGIGDEVHEAMATWGQRP
jgi:hypothetical protein